MSPLIVTTMVVYAFCAGLVAARVWRRVNNLNFMLKEKLVITAIWACCCLVSWPFPWGDGGAEMTREQIVRYQAESVKRANLPPVAKHSQTKTNQPQKEAA